MQPDPSPEEGGTAPDHVPDDFLALYGSQARNAIRYHRSKRYRLAKQVRHASTPLRDREVWSLAALVFFWGVAAVGMLGGLGYAIFLWPKVGLSILGAVIALLGLSLGISLWLNNRDTAPRRAS